MSWPDSVLPVTPLDPAALPHQRITYPGRLLKDGAPYRASCSTDIRITWAKALKEQHDAGNCATGRRGG